MKSSTDPNVRQVGGEHYKSDLQHWDYVWANDLDYFQGQITKYVTRWREKNGVEDLKKAQHFLEKYISLVDGGQEVFPDRANLQVSVEWTKVQETPQGTTWRCTACGIGLFTGPDTPLEVAAKEHICPACEPQGRGYVDQD